MNMCSEGFVQYTMNPWCSKANLLLRDNINVHNLWGIKLSCFVFLDLSAIDYPSGILLHASCMQMKYCSFDFKSDRIIAGNGTCRKHFIISFCPSEMDILYFGCIRNSTKLALGSPISNQNDVHNMGNIFDYGHLKGGPMWLAFYIWATYRIYDRY